MTHSVTPGPWSWELYARGYVLVGAPKGGSTVRPPVRISHATDDGRLIAAAPDLLAACEAQEAAADARMDCECENQCPWWQCGPCSDRMGRALELRRTALAKATSPQGEGSQA